MTRARARIGTVLRRKYRIDRVLGVGGMAVVYAATHEVNHAEFAIKMLHPELSIRKDIATRFLREGLVGNTVKHKGVVKVLDNDVAEDGAAFLVMELLDGTGVEQLWEKHGHKLPTRVVLAIAHQLLDVLAAAHTKQIVHRDIKPANLFLTREGVVKVLDFGIARLRDATAESATHTGMLLGTPAYMAPEQALAQSSQIDGLTDLWAVGATMFSMLCGQTVHVGENAQQLMVQAATQPSRSLASLAEGVSPRVVAVVDRAVAFDKAQRWPGAAEMRDAVRDAFLAEFSANVSIAPLVALFEEGDTGRAPTFYANAVASTPVARAHQSASPTVTSAGLLLAAPKSTPVPPAPPATGAVPATMRAAEASAAPRLVLVGGTTAQPVSAEARPGDSVRPSTPSSGKMVGGVAAVVAVLAIGTGMLVVRLRGTSATQPAAVETIMSPPPAAPPLPDPSTAPAATPAAPPSSAISAAAPVATPAAASPGPRPAPGTRPAVAPSAIAAKSAAPPPAPAPAPPSAAPAPAPTPAPSCHVESHLDVDGNKVYSTVCK